MKIEATNIRVTIGVDLSEHEGHKVRSLTIDKEKGIKALYCIADGKMIEYLFRRSKGWTDESAIQFAEELNAQIKSLSHIQVDQNAEFLKVIALFADEKSVDYLPNTPSFDYHQDDITTKQLDEEEDPKDAKSQSEGDYDVNQEFMQMVKFDESRRLVYGVFLWPEEADTDGDVISASDIELCAHKFMADYRDIDEMHKKDTLDADIVESAIAWTDGLDFYGKSLKKGCWFGAVKVYDDKVWEKIQSGEYKGFSVRISGIRQTIE